MKTTMKKLATATLMLLAVATVQAQPIVLPAPGTTGTESGSFTVNANNQITITGNHIILTTSLPAKGNIASGAAQFKSGDLQYNDGSSTLDGKIAQASFGRQTSAGQIVYQLKGEVFGKLSQAGQTVDVNGHFSVTTKPAAIGTPLSQAALEASSVIVSIRSNVNNTQPVRTQQRTHSGSHLKH